MKTMRIGMNTVLCSENGRGLFPEDNIREQNCSIVFEMMQDCLNCIHHLMAPNYPKAQLPQLYIAKSEVVNALAVDNKIIVFSELIRSAGKLIEKRYSDDMLKRYGILSKMSGSEVRSAMRVNLWRYVVLHELYHIWNQHTVWKKQYYFDEAGVLKKRVASDTSGLMTNVDIWDEIVQIWDKTKANAPDLLQVQENLTKQALEMEADSSAVCMLVNLMMCDTDQRNLTYDDRIEHVRQEVALIMGAISTAFCLFDKNAGAKFDMLDKLKDTSHPLPSIRMVYAEEIADGCLNHYFQDEGELRYIEEEWNKLVCDVDSDNNGTVDMGQVFYYTAYTRAAQEHVSLLKRRMIDMHDSLSILALANTAPKLDIKDTEVLESSIWFTNEGQSIRGWINPATGLPTAIRRE